MTDTKTSEMVERSGAAMMRGEVGRRLTRLFTDDEIRGLARAGIEVMREITPAMRRAFHDAQETVEDGGGYSPDFQWNAMIDEALR